MKVVDINIQEPYFSLILDGKKTIEVRLNKGKFIEVEIGDVFNINYQTEFEIIDKKKYSSFKDILLEEGIENISPDKKTIKDALDTYYRFYSKDDEIKYGVIGFKLKTYKKIGNN